MGLRHRRPGNRLAAGVLFGLPKALAAVDATFGDVCSMDFFVVAIKASFGWVGNCVWPNVKLTGPLRRAGFGLGF